MAVLAVIYVWSQLRSRESSRPAGPQQTSMVATHSDPDIQQLIDGKNETKLVESLKSPQAHVRDSATSALWKIWQAAAGPDAERRLQAGIDMLATGHPLAAVDHFSKIIGEYPSFAEAYNQRAMAYFSVEDFERSIQDCLKATELNKNHFGAWNGLGKCYLAIHRYDLALNAFERASELQPFSEEDKRFIEFCKERKKNVVPQDLNNSA